MFSHSNFNFGKVRFDLKSSGIKEKLAGAWQQTKKFTIDAASITATFVRPLATNFCLGLVQNFRSFPETVNAVFKSQDVRDVLKEVIKNNAMYAGEIIAYWAVRPFIATFFVEGENSKSLWLMDKAVGTYFMTRLSFAVTVKDSVHNVSLSRAAGNWMPVVDARIEAERKAIAEAKIPRAAGIAEHSQFSPCPHGSIVIGRDLLVDGTVGYIGTSFGLLVLSWIKPFDLGPYDVGPLLSWAATPFFNGYVLSEYRINDKCTNCRVDILAQNNLHSAGAGTISSLGAWTASGILYLLTGINSSFIDQAFKNCFMKWGVLSASFRSEPFPSNEPRFDMFRYSRTLSNFILKDIVTSIAPKSECDKIAKQKSIVDISDAKAISAYQKIKDVISWLAKKGLGKEFSSMAEISQQSTMKIFIRLNKDDISAGLKIIETARSKEELAKTVERAVSMLPDFLLPAGVNRQELAVILKILYSAHLDEIKQDVHDFACLAGIDLNRYAVISAKFLASEGSQEAPPKAISLERLEQKDYANKNFADMSHGAITELKPNASPEKKNLQIIEDYVPVSQPPVPQSQSKIRRGLR